MNWTNRPDGPHQREGVADELCAPLRRLIEQRQAGDDGRNRLARQFRERPRKIVSVALNDHGWREAFPQQPAESGIVFDQREPLARNAGLDQRPRHRTGAGPKLDDEPVRRGTGRRRHRPRQRAPGGRDRAGEPRRGDERFEKTRAVGEPRTDAAYSALDPAFRLPADERRAPGAVRRLYRRSARLAKAAQPRPSKNSFILAKKPALSGWVWCEDSAANSVKSSRWRRVRLCGVSTLS